MAENDLRKDVETLRADLDTLRKDVSKLVQTTGRQMGDKASKSARQAEHEIEELRARLDELVGDAKARGREHLHEIESHIEQRPLVSLGIAFAVGMVLGRLLDRR